MAFRDNRSSGGGSFPGYLVCKPQYRHMFRVFKCTQNGIDLRFYPELDAQGNPLPVRFGKQPSDIGNWLYDKHLWLNDVGGGLPGKERLLLPLNIEGDEHIEHFDSRRAVMVWKMVRDTLSFYLKNEDAKRTTPPMWFKLSDGDSLQAPIRKSKMDPRNLHLARCSVLRFVSKGKPIKSATWTKPLHGCIVYFQKNSLDALGSLLMARNENNQALTGDDLDKIFKYNTQLVHPTTGCVIKFGPMGFADASASAGIGSGEDGDYAADDDKRDPKFAIDAVVDSKSVYPLKPTLLKDFCTIPWSQLVQTFRDEADLISALTMGLPDELIAVTFAKYKSWLPAHLHDVLQSPVVQRMLSFDVPAGFDEADNDYGPSSFNTGTVVGPAAAQPSPPAPPEPPKTTVETRYWVSIPGQPVFETNAQGVTMAVERLGDSAFSVMPLGTTDWRFPNALGFIKRVAPTPPPAPAAPPPPPAPPAPPAPPVQAPQQSNGVQPNGAAPQDLDSVMAALERAGQQL